MAHRGEAEPYRLPCIGGSWESAINNGRTCRDAAAAYTAACDSNGYRVMLDGEVIKTYFLDALCRSLPETYRVRASVEFAVYDIFHSRFMLG